SLTCPDAPLLAAGALGLISMLRWSNSRSQTGSALRVRWPAAALHVPQTDSLSLATRRIPLVVLSRLVAKPLHALPLRSMPREQHLEAESDPFLRLGALVRRSVGSLLPRLGRARLRPHHAHQRLVHVL